RFNDLNVNLLKKKYIPDLINYNKKYIDVWLLTSLSENIAPTVSFALQLCALMNNSGLLYSYKLRVIAIVDDENKVKNEKQKLKNLLRITRIRATALVVCITEKDHQLGLSIDHRMKQTITESESIESIYALFSSTTENDTTD